MIYRKFLSAVVLLIAMMTAVFAQDEADLRVPIDPDIRMGTLENGITYYIKENHEPANRASFYLIRNVGAVMEEEEQNGLAHFLEHMSFNGTLNFPGKAIINKLEKHGVAFGYNINAYTGFDETVYNISDVPINDPGLLDTCLLILHDWSYYVSLDEKEIDLERGVISEEYRTSKTATRRMVISTLPVLLEGTMYAKRDIIGSLDVIQNFPYSAIRDFYRDWYRTDLQAIAIVGDIDVDEVEAKVRELFSTIPAVENPKPRVYQEVPWHADTRYVLAQDKEASISSVEVVALRKSVPIEDKNLDYIRNRHIISLMNSMASARISEILQKDNPPFVSGSIAYGPNGYARGYDEFSIYAVPLPNEEAAALKAVYTEAERIRRHGFTESELDRAKAIMAANYEIYYNQKDKIDNDTYIGSFQDYFLNGEPLTSVDFDYNFLNMVLPSISAEEVSALYRELFTEENRTIIVMGLEGDGITHISKEEALAIIDEVGIADIEPYDEGELATSLVETDIKGSAIAATSPLPQFDAVEWTLENNVKVIYRRADHEKDNVALNAFSYGGTSLLDDDEVLPAYLLSTLSSLYGVGDFDNISLQKMMAGKKASVSFDLSETAEVISGSSTPKDFETMMQLLYLKFTEPRFDKTAHDAYMQRLISYVENMANDPNKIMNDSISLITTAYSPRTVILNRETLSTVSVDDIEKIYRDRFAGADEFIFFIVGNIDEETVKPMVEKYIGGLPVTGRIETFTDRKTGQPKGRVDKNIGLELTIPKSTVFISFENKMEYTPYNTLGLSVINGILDIVYTEKVREEEGGTYGVQVSVTGRKTPSARVKALITFDCDPDRADELKKIVFDQLKYMGKRGPSEENLEKTVLNLLKNREESKRHNSYWTNVLLRYYQLGINSDDPNNFEDILNAYTVRDIKKITKKSFKKADLVDMTFSPLK
ncbi:MAG: M16 family metallopeptidase [Bacteroidales bacterium]|jgi:zinc protease